MISKKKGFTLVELLATIIILGLLVTIAYVSVTSILNSGNDSYYESQENMLVLAGREYYADHRSELPKEIGDTSTVPLETLVEENYIEQITDKDSNDCDNDNSGVTVQKITEKDFQYYGTLVCGSYKTNSDKAKPAISFEPNKKSSEDPIDVTMKITDNKEVKSYRYVIIKDGEEYQDSGYQTYNGDITINLTELGLYRITGYAIDSSGNMSTRRSGQYSIYKGIDCGQVEIISSIDEEVFTNKDISISFKLPSNTYRVELSKSVNGGADEVIGSYYGNSIPNILLNTEGKHKVKAVLYDQHGNSCTASTGEYYLDKTAPELNVISKKKNTSTNLTEEDDIDSLEDYPNDTWYKGYTVLKGDCSDENGSCNVSYKVTGASSNTDGFVNKKIRNINAEGISTIEYRASDEAGNVTERTYTVKLDRTDPTLSVALKKKANSSDLGNNSNIDSLANYTNNTWYNGYVVLRGSCSDGQSNCNISYEVTGASSNTNGFVEGTTRNINADGTSTIKYRATDEVGNYVEDTYTVKLDHTKPTIKYNHSGGTYKQSSLEVCATATDDVGIGSVRMQVYKSGSQIKDINDTNVNGTSKQVCYTLSGYGSYTVYTRTYDLAGNVQSTTPQNNYSFYYQNYTLQQPKTVSVVTNNYYVCPNDQNKPSRSECEDGYYNTLYVNNVSVSGTTVSMDIRLHMNKFDLSCKQGQVNTLCIANSSNKCVKNIKSWTINCHSPAWTSTGANVYNSRYSVDVSSWAKGNYRVIVDGATTKFRFKTSKWVRDTFKIS